MISKNPLLYERIVSLQDSDQMLLILESALASPDLIPDPRDFGKVDQTCSLL